MGSSANPDAPLIVCDDHAGDEPTVVLVHGLSCDGSDWGAQVEHFSGRNRVITVDLRGHGRSMHFDDEFNMPRAGHDVAALMRSLKIKSAVLAGHSMGCRVVTEAALAAPEIVRGVVLVDGSRFATDDPDAAAANMRAAIDAHGYAALSEKMFASMFVPGTSEAISQPIVERAINRPPQIASAFMCAMVAWDAAQFETCYGKLTAPLSIVQSTHRDSRGARIELAPEMTVDWHELLKTLVANVTIDRVYGAGHFTQIDTPQRVNQAIDALA
jgi:pimeloyl-ACP methyl ester carboxylesterase